MNAVNRLDFEGRGLQIVVNLPYHTGDRLIAYGHLDISSRRYRKAIGDQIGIGLVDALRQEHIRICMLTRHFALKEVWFELIYLQPREDEMKFFIDSADVNEIRELAETGLVDGVTTNPSLILKSGRQINEVIKEICALVDGPVSAEVTATDYKTMMTEAHHLAKLAKNVAIKVPLTPDGLKACYSLSSEGTMVNVTLCFSAAQAILAAKAGATFISPFIGRLDDIGQDGITLIEEIRQIYDNYDNFKTEILAASIRHPMHVVQSAMAGADVATIPAKVMKQLYQHPLTDNGLAAFIEDWKKTGQKIVA